MGKRLTAKAVENLARGRYSDSDGSGLMLWVRKGGGRSWVQRLTINGKRRDIGLGPYPLVTLAAARELAVNNKRQVLSGRDPVAVKKKAQAEARKRINFAEASKRELRPIFRTVSLLTLRGHFPSHIFKSLHRCLVANTGMPALSVVEDLDVFEDCSLGLSAGSEPLTVHQLLFQ